MLHVVLSVIYGLQQYGLLNNTARYASCIVLFFCNLKQKKCKIDLDAVTEFLEKKKSKFHSV